MKKNELKNIAVSKNIEWCLDISYERTTGYFGCYCEGSCSCTILENIDFVIPENGLFLYENIMRKDDIYLYCLEKIAQLLQFYDKNNYEIIINKGYYGEEITGVEFYNKNLLVEHLEAIENKNDTELMEYILEMEYGYILNRFKNAQYTVKHIDVNDLRFSNNEYFKKISNKTNNHYRNISLKDKILGIYYYDGVKYNLIDGYHRLVAAKQSNLDKGKIIVAS